MLSDREFSAVADEFTPLFVILQDDDRNKIIIPNSLIPQQMFVVYHNPGRRRKLDPAESPYPPPGDARDDVPRSFSGATGARPGDARCAAADP